MLVVVLNKVAWSEDVSEGAFEISGVGLCHIVPT